MYMSEFCSSKLLRFVELLTAITSDLPMKKELGTSDLKVETETVVHYESQHQSH